MGAAQDERKHALERAVEEAEAAGQSEVEDLKAQAAEEKQQLQANAGARIDHCARRVMDHLRQM